MKSRNKLFYPHFPIRNNCSTFETNYPKIGRGKFGNLYQAENDRAIKVVKKRKVIEENMIQQLLDEKTNNLLCSHNANILDLVDFWQDDYNLYFTYPLCKESLWAAVKEGRLSLSEEESLLKVADHFIKAVSFLHDLGIVHRDVKLENILVSSEGKFLLSDFGLSKKLTRRQRTSTICGTLQYMAPEIAEERSYYHVVDWWSVGIAMHRLAFGHFPYEKGKDHKELLKNITVKNIPSHSNPFINDLIYSCLQRDELTRAMRVREIAEISEKGKTYLNQSVSNIKQLDS